MFTGLIREVGRVESIGRHASITRLDLSAPHTAVGLAPGDSLAVNGICLTVTRRTDARVTVEATEETRRVTTLGRWKSGDRVHLEPSLRAGDQIGGHFVLGHVDGTGRVAKTERRGEAMWMTVSLSRELASRLLPKGSIAVDGVSLTLDEGPFDDRFTVTLIPHTLAVTRLGAMAVGETVNLELDVLAKAVDFGLAPARGARSLSVRAGVNRAEGGRSSADPTFTLASLFARGWQKGGAR